MTGQTTNHLPATRLTTVALLCALLAPSLSSAQAKAPKACQEDSYRQFDFWIGAWDVLLPDGSKAGENRIESIASGCALQESWKGRGGFSGSSLNSYDSSDRNWHQTWVDSTGGRLELAGGLEAGAMVLSATAPDPQKPNVKVTQRISWSVNGDGSVRQFWQSSEDGGKTWATVFDGRYVRKNP